MINFKYFKGRGWMFYIPFGFVIVLFILDYLLYGNSISGDTERYLRLAARWKEGVVPTSKSYLVGFSWIIAQISLIGNIPLYKSIILFQGVLFLINSAIVYILVQKISKTYNYPVWISGLACVLLAGGWSFRIQKAAHADALFYTCFLAYMLLMYYSTISAKKRIYFLISFVLLIAVTVKYNAYLLLPFTAIAFFINKKKSVNQILLTTLVLIPSVVQILIWRSYNGRFINKLNADHYNKDSIDFGRVFDSLVTNLNNTGRVFCEWLINPVIARMLPEFLMLFFYSLVFSFCFYIFFKTKNKFTQVVSIYIIIYLVIFIGMSSLNYFTETNHRTLISVGFSLFLLIILTLSEFSFIKRYIYVPLVIIVFINSGLLFNKWIFETSRSSSFYNIAKAIKENPDDFDLKEKSTASIVYSNKINYIQVKYDYSLNVIDLEVSKKWFLGRWVQLSEQEKNNNLKKVINDINNGAVLHINHPEAEEKEFIKKISNHIKPINKGLNSYLFSK
jgi:hypothetical protein